MNVYGMQEYFTQDCLKSIFLTLGLPEGVLSDPLVREASLVCDISIFNYLRDYSLFLSEIFYEDRCY